MVHFFLSTHSLAISCFLFLVVCYKLMGEILNDDDDTIIVIVIRHIIMISVVMIPYVHDMVFSLRVHCTIQKIISQFCSNTKAHCKLEKCCSEKTWREPVNIIKYWIIWIRIAWSLTNWRYGTWTNQKDEESRGDNDFRSNFIQPHICYSNTARILTKIQWVNVYKL